MREDSLLGGKDEALKSLFEVDEESIRGDGRFIIFCCAAAAAASSLLWK